jgi:arylsulfatase
MIVTHGGLVGGYGLYVQDGKPTFVYNCLDVERPTFTAREPVPRGKAKIVVDFAYAGKKGEIGKGGRITLSVNGKTVAQGKLERTAPLSLSIRGAGHRHGRRLGGGLHLQAAV